MHSVSNVLMSFSLLAVNCSSRFLLHDVILCKQSINLKIYGTFCDLFELCMNQDVPEERRGITLDR